MRSILAVAIFLSFTASASAYDFTHVGVGGGGMLHAGAFHPDPLQHNTLVVGADVSGVYRTDDFGLTWYPWNEGLTNDYEARSFYVDDLVGVTYAGFTGWYAATHGGIWSAVETGPWECVTPGGSFYYTTTDGLSAAIGFSCVAWDGNNKLVAGAGPNRWATNYETTYYPGLEPATVIGGSHGASEYTVWTLDLDDANPTWQPDSTAVFGSARDISIAEIEVNGEPVEFIVVTTKNGIFVHDGTQWTDFDQYPEASPTGANFMYLTNHGPWDVHLTPRGSIYVAMNCTSGTQHPNLYNGIYRLHDVRADANQRWWGWVGDTTTAVAPTNSAMSTIFGNTQTTKMPFFTVKNGSGTEPDRIFGGAREGWLHPGLYIANVVYSANYPSTAWQHRVYDGVGIIRLARNSSGVVSTINDHWQTIWGGVPQFAPVVSAATASNVFLDLNGLYVVSADDGESWVQNGTVDQGGSWSTTGYSELCIRGLAFDSAGRLIEAPGDVGAFRSTDNTLEDLARFAPPVDKFTSGSSDVAWTNQTDNVVVRESWRGGGDAYFVLFGEAHGSANRASKLFMYDGAWHNVTASVPNLDRYVFYRCGFYDDSTCFLSYLKYDDAVSVSGRRIDEIGVLRGTYDGAAWTWTAINNGLSYTDGVNAMNVYGSDFLLNPASGRLYMSAMNLVVSELTCTQVSTRLDIKGAIYVADDPTATNPTWTKVFGGAGTDYMDFRCLAQSAGGELMYTGTRGRATGRGSVLICNLPSYDDTAWEPMLNTAATGYPLDFASLLNQGWSQDRANKTLTDVRSIVVNPWNRRIIYVGLWSEGMHSQRGVWTYSPRGGWSNLTADAPFNGITVMAQAIDVRDEGTANEHAILAIGTGGIETWHTTLIKPEEYDDDVPDPEDPPLMLRIGQRVNPDGASTFSFNLKQQTSVEISIYDVRGRLLRRISTQVLAAGENSVQWDNRDNHGSRVASGVYLARIVAGDSVATGKFVLVK